MENEKGEGQGFREKGKGDGVGRVKASWRGGSEREQIQYEASGRKRRGRGQKGVTRRQEGGKPGKEGGRVRDFGRVVCHDTPDNHIKEINPGRTYLTWAPYPGGFSPA